MTLPAGFGTHKRDVYVELEDGADFEQVAEAIRKDPYFVKDETRVTRVNKVMEVEAMGHGVLLREVRKLQGRPRIKYWAQDEVVKSVRHRSGDGGFGKSHNSNGAGSLCFGGGAAGQSGCRRQGRAPQAPGVDEKANLS